MVAGGGAASNAWCGVWGSEVVQAAAFAVDRVQAKVRTEMVAGGWGGVAGSLEPQAEGIVQRMLCGLGIPMRDPWLYFVAAIHTSSSLRH